MRKKIVLAEIVLMLASVIIFRSIWLLLDKYFLMNNAWVLLISLIIAMVVAIISFHYIYSNRK